MTYVWYKNTFQEVFFSKAFPTKTFSPLDYEVIKEIRSEQIFHMESIQTAILCGVFMYFSISPGRMFFSLCNCCCVWTLWWRLSSVMKPSSYFWHRHCLLWVYFFMYMEPFPLARGFSFLKCVLQLLFLWERFGAFSDLCSMLPSAASVKTHT